MNDKTVKTVRYVTDAAPTSQKMIPLVSASTKVRRPVAHGAPISRIQPMKDTQTRQGNSQFSVQEQTGGSYLLVRQPVEPMSARIIRRIRCQTQTCSHKFEIEEAPDYQCNDFAYVGLSSLKVVCPECGSPEVIDGWG